MASTKQPQLQPSSPQLSAQLSAALVQSGDYVQVQGQLYCADCGRPHSAPHGIACSDSRELRRTVERLRLLREVR